ncbi:MAG: hypothetical protein WC475_02670 [Candidatus Paceibacterota bacterium]
MAETNQKDCCRKKAGNKPGSADKGFLAGIFYGLIPHTFCIAFVVFSVIGAATGTLLFKRFLLFPYFFQFLVFLSFLSATISALVYLKRNGILSWRGAKRKWKYLGILYGTTIFINLLFFFVIFPAVANLGSASKTVSSAGDFQSSLASLTLAVDIPCSGHAPLVINELKGIIGVDSVKFKLPNLFEISYDSARTSPITIISLDIFKTFKAIIK